MRPPRLDGVVLICCHIVNFLNILQTRLDGVVQHRGDDHIGVGARESRERRRDVERLEDERIARVAHLAAPSE